MAFFRSREKAAADSEELPAPFIPEFAIGSDKFQRLKIAKYWQSRFEHVKVTLRAWLNDMHPNSGSDLLTVQAVARRSKAPRLSLGHDYMLDHVLFFGSHMRMLASNTSKEKDLMVMSEFLSEEAVEEVANILFELFAVYGTKLPAVPVFRATRLQFVIGVGWPLLLNHRSKAALLWLEEYELQFFPEKTLKQTVQASRQRSSRS